MQRRFQTLTELMAHGCETVIDVRSPSEFAEDHLPGAVSMPVLDDAQRAEVGTIYVQQSAFLARKIGAAMVYRNAAQHIETHLMEKPGGWRPLVYCWRGGQRSGSFAHLLQQIGWRAEVVSGGYQSYRRLVKAALYDAPLGLRVVALDGYTGTAKTDVLHLLRQRGVQVLDLEGLARHRGSLLGEMPGGQPSQKQFESDIAMCLEAADPLRPLVVEAEANKIGARIIPPSLWSAMKVAPRIAIQAPVAARVTYLTEAYADILADGERLKDRLDPLRQFRGHGVVDGWCQSIDVGDKPGLVAALITQHYDLAYQKAQRAIGVTPAHLVRAERLDAAGLAQLAADIDGVLSRM